ncbi:MAG TPA: capsule assembly Wzi family protein [Mesotoga infera]|nr:capsule assembly Wzi family protein [Thermotogaceae bacterium]HON27562.1 capsule assembly Wzi family protein [Mesotoga infera]HPD37154.1 capsule assembly Wzi family protein [Mesotoga infera]HRR43110.1 capsule assembly Wzi family protein [Mesotoga sp.]HRV00271.1 capsule assembly Wzi family protein [Mesotoga sp.]
MKKILLPILLVLSIALLANQGELILKGTLEHDLLLGRNLIEGKTLFTPNTAIPESFASVQMGTSPLKSNSVTEVSLRLTPQFLIHNFEPFKETSWLESKVPLYLRYRYDTLKPWTVLAFESDISQNLKGYINLDVPKDYRSYISHGIDFNTKPYMNFPVEIFEGKLQAIDMSWPSFGYISYGNGGFYASLGRYKIAWGPMRNGLMISDASMYYDNISSTYTTALGSSGRFTYSFVFISSNSMLNSEEWIKQDKVWDLNQRRPYTEGAKTIIGHRFDVQFAPWVRLGVGEVNLVGGKHPDLNDINPFVIFHNTYGEDFSNVMASVDFSVVPFKGVELYGELVSDDVAFGATEAGARGKPTALAYGGGIRYSTQLKEIMLLASIELYHTDTWMYNRWQPLLIFTNRIYTKSELPGSRDFTDYPLGFKYGPDMNAFSLSAKGFFQNGMTVSLVYDHFRQGEVTLKTPYLNMDDPSDDPGEFTDPEDWAGPVGETVSANIVTLAIAFPYRDFTFGGDFSLYFGDYFKKYGGYEKAIFEIRPYISYVF